MPLRAACQEQVSATSLALAKANDRIVALQGLLQHHLPPPALPTLTPSTVAELQRWRRWQESLRAAQQDVRVKEQLYQAALAGKREVESQSEAVTTDASKRLDQYLVRARAATGECLSCSWHGLKSLQPHRRACGVAQAKQQALRQQLTDTEAKASTAEARASRLAQQLQRSERQLQQTQSLLMVVREQKDQLQVTL